MGTIQIVVIVYVVVCLGIGIWSSKFQTNTEEFFVAGKRLGPIVLGLAVSSTIMSGMGLVGTFGSIYSGGYPPIMISIWATVGTLVSYLLLAEPLRRVSGKFGAITLSDFVYLRYQSEGARLVTTIAIIIGVTGYIMTNLASLGTVIRMAFGWNYTVSLTVGTVILLAYVVMGGMLAAAVTDAVQSVLMMFFGIACCVVTMRFSGGISGLNETLNSAGESLTSLVRPGTMYNPIWFIGTIILYGLGVSGQPHVVNKFYQIHKKSKWKQSMAIATVSYFLVCLPHVGALGARAQYIKGLFPDMMANTNEVSTQFILQYFSPIVAGLMLAAIVAAVMSTCDSQVLTVSAAFTRDLIFRYFYKKELSEKKQLFISRVVMVVFMLISYFLVFNPPSVITWMGNGAWGICASVLFPLLVLGVRWRRGNKIAAIVCGIVGISLSFGLVVLQSLIEFTLPVNAAIIGFVGATASYVVLSLILPTESNPVFPD